MPPTFGRRCDQRLNEPEHTLCDGEDQGYYNRVGYTVKCLLALHGRIVWR